MRRAFGVGDIVAPRVGGPFIAPEYRFRPFAELRSDGYGEFTPERQAHVIVTVPDANAKVWIQGQLMSESGTRRAFASPMLEPGFTYSYEIRARWGDAQQTTEQTRTINVRPGQEIDVDFSRPPVRTDR